MEYFLDLKIENLVLEGFPPQERSRVGHAIQQGLVRIFNEKGIPPSFQQNLKINHLNLGNINLQPYQKPEAIGNQVAHKIFNALNNG